MAAAPFPVLAGRIESFFDRAGNRDRFAPNGVEAEIRRLYYDTANATHPASMAALTNLIPRIFRSTRSRFCDTRCHPKISPRFPVAMRCGCYRA